MKFKKWLGPLLLLCFSMGSIMIFGRYLAAQRTDLEERFELGNRLESIVAAVKNDERLMLDVAKEADIFFHVGQTTDVVSASILTKLNKYAALQSVQIMRSGTAHADSEDVFATASVFVEMTGTESAIYNFLQQIELSRPILLISKIRIHGDILANLDEVAEPFLSAEVTVNGALQPASTE